MIERRVKVLCSLSLLLITCSSIWYTIRGFPLPRPIPIFILLGLAISLLSGGVFLAQNRAGYLFIAVVGLLNGIFLRASGFLTVVSSGLDHGRWFARVSSTIDVGYVPGNDMYAASPLYILELAISNIILGGPVVAVRFVTLLIGATLPLLVFLIIYNVSRDLQAGVFTLLLAVPHVFYLRTATLMESESMALPWFVLAIFFFIQSARTKDRRYQVLLIGTVGTAVMLHFFYSVIILLSLSGAYFLHRLARVFKLAEIDDGAADAAAIALAVGFVIVPVWMLWSVYAHTAAVTFISVFSIPAYDSITQILLPSSDTAAEATGNSGNGGLITTLGKFFPLLAVFSAGAFGGVYALLKERDRYYILILLALTVGGATFILIAVQIDYNLGFRMYYFTSVFAIIFAAILFTRLTDTRMASIRPLALVFVCIFMLTYAVGGPISPLGNNVDPRFGGSSWAVTHTDVSERNAMDSWTEGGKRIPNRLEQVHRSFSPRFTSEDLYLARSCGHDAKLGTTGGFVLCGPSD